MNADAPTPRDDRPPARSLWAPLPLLLVAAMIAGSLLMWLVSPVFWLWLASRIAAWTSGSAQPTLPLYLLILGGVIVTAIAIGRMLGIINRAHMRITGLDRGHGWRSGWTKSMRDTRGATRDRGLLEIIMLISVGLAGLAATIWFLFFAHPPMTG